MRLVLDVLQDEKDTNMMEVFIVTDLMNCH